MVSLPRGRKPNQVPCNASPYVCDRKAYIPPQAALHFAQLVRPLENYFYAFLAGLSLTVAGTGPSSSGVTTELHGELARAVDSWHAVSSEGSPSDDRWPSPWALQAALATCRISVCQLKHLLDHRHWGISCSVTSEMQWVTELTTDSSR